MSAKIKKFFETNPLGWGATFSSHPVTLACGYEVLKYMIENKTIEHTEKMGKVMEREMNRVADKHISVRGGRNLGLFGCFDLVGKDGNYLNGYAQPPHPFAAALGAEMRK